MDDTTSLFDAAMQAADDVIREVFGVTATLTIKKQPVTVVGDFYDPRVSEHLPGSAALLDGTSPVLFVKSADVIGVKRQDVVTIAQRVFWVSRVGPDDSGSRHLSLIEGDVPADAQYRG